MKILERQILGWFIMTPIMYEPWFPYTAQDPSVQKRTVSSHLYLFDRV